ncbi:MAG TPA: glycoside hydrolase family 19 protein [Archangium sp.]|nr:glycoside hydrolase family 19 protein [Archangium sp.]
MLVGKAVAGILASVATAVGVGLARGGGITLEQLRAVMPHLAASKAEEYLPLLNKAMRAGKISTKPRRAAFLAQLAHESGELRWAVEFADGTAYEGRTNLGNTQKGDGPRYKGRGWIQLTGRANYRAAGKALGLPLEDKPELAAEPAVAFQVAVWFWNSRSLSQLADVGDFENITRRINGGLNGYDARKMYHARALAAL